MLNKRYFKFLGSNIIYEITAINNKKITGKNGNVIIHTVIDNVEFTDKPQNSADHKRGYGITLYSKNIPNEIMLRHLTSIEAISELDKYIDQAIVCKLPEVRIIHGRHGGTIRKAVRKYLDEHPFVSSYRYADYYEGSLGVTIATLGTKKENK